MRWLSNTSRSPGSMSDGLLARPCRGRRSRCSRSCAPGRRSGTCSCTGSRWLPGSTCRQPFSSVASVTASHSPTMRPRRLEREVVRVLVPGLSPGARVLEDELRQEAVDVAGAEQVGDHGQQLAACAGTTRRPGRRCRRNTFETDVLGVRLAVGEVRLRLGQDQRVLHRFTRGRARGRSSTTSSSIACPTAGSAKPRSVAKPSAS